MSIQWFDTKKKLCDCEADITQVSTVIPARRGKRRRLIRARQIRHYRKRDEAHFWHWEDSFAKR